MKQGLYFSKFIFSPLSMVRSNNLLVNIENYLWTKEMDFDEEKLKLFCHSLYPQHAAWKVTTDRDIKPEWRERLGKASWKRSHSGGNGSWWLWIEYLCLLSNSYFELLTHNLMIIWCWIVWTVIDCVVVIRLGNLMGRVPGKRWEPWLI